MAGSPRQRGWPRGTGGEVQALAGDLGAAPAAPGRELAFSGDLWPMDGALPFGK